MADIRNRKAFDASKRFKIFHKQYATQYEPVEDIFAKMAEEENLLSAVNYLDRIITSENNENHKERHGFVVYESALPPSNLESEVMRLRAELGVGNTITCESELFLCQVYDVPIIRRVEDSYPEWSEYWNCWRDKTFYRSVVDIERWFVRRISPEQYGDILSIGPLTLRGAVVLQRGEPFVDYL